MLVTNNNRNNISSFSKILKQYCIIKFLLRTVLEKEGQNWILLDQFYELGKHSTEGLDR